MQTFSSASRGGDHFSSEFAINETPIGARNLLTKGFVQDEIGQRSGAAISTRGRFMAKGERPKGPNDRPLYLFVQGPTKRSVDAAVREIDEIIADDASSSGAGVRRERVFVAFGRTEGARARILGEGGSNLRYIRQETGASVSLRDSNGPVHLLIEHADADALSAARRLAVDLLETLERDVREEEERRARMMSAPPPPPFPDVRQPPPPIVSIPPPGIHIPQHAGPMVPPPQMVAAGPGNVLVMAPPPPSRPVFLSQDLGAASSAGAFSLLRGNVLYHQAPPVQTQAQIGDGLHIISAPPQASFESVNLAPPPPQMIIAQVRVEPEDAKRISFQAPKTQFVIQPAAAVETFTSFGVCQTSTPASVIFTVPYRMTGPTSTSCTTIGAVVHHPDEAKRAPRQIMHTGIIPVRRPLPDDRAQTSVPPPTGPFLAGPPPQIGQIPPAPTGPPPRRPPPHQQFAPPPYDRPPAKSDRNQDGQGRPRQNQGGRSRKPSRSGRPGHPWNKIDQDKYQNGEPGRQNREDDHGGEGRPRGSERSQSEDREYENDTGKSSGQRNYHYDKHDGKSDSSANRKRLEKKYDQDDGPSDSSRKRKYESDSNWISRSESNQSASGDSTRTSHKSRLDQDEIIMSDAGSQPKQGGYKVSSSKAYGGASCDPTKPDKDNSSKWLEQSGDPARSNIAENLKHEDDEIPGIVDQCSNQTHDLGMEKHGEPSSWNDQTCQFQIQNMSEVPPRYNSSLSSVHVFQNNMPYLLPPPPPPPPHTQYSLPPGSSANHIAQTNIQAISQPLSIQNTVPNVNQALMTSHMVANSINQSVPFEGIISNASSISQTVSVQPVIQSQPIVAQILPSSMAQSVVANITQTIPPIMTQGFGQTITNVIATQPIINQSSMGQTMSMQPVMVPPPSQTVTSIVATPIIATNRRPPSMVPNGQNMSVAPPLPPSQTMSAQPAFPYWMG